MLDVESPNDTNYTKLAADAVHELSREVAGSYVSPVMDVNHPQRIRILREIRNMLKKSRGNITLYVQLTSKAIKLTTNLESNGQYCYEMRFIASKFHSLTHSAAVYNG